MNHVNFVDAVVSSVNTRWRWQSTELLIITWSLGCHVVTCASISMPRDDLHVLRLALPSPSPAAAANADLCRPRRRRAKSGGGGVEASDVVGGGYRFVLWDGLVGRVSGDCGGGAAVHGMPCLSRRRWGGGGGWGGWAGEPGMAQYVFGRQPLLRLLPQQTPEKQVGDNQ